MISFREVKVVSFSLQYQDVYWEIENTNEDLQEYDFYVERGEAELGPWALVAGPLVDRFYLRDNNVPLMNANRELFYRVRAVNRISEDELSSKVFSRNGPLPLDALEIVRNEELVLREHAGTKAWVFPIRTFGQRCPQCWDRALMKVTDDACPTCWGTGFSNGYHYPVECWVQLDSATKVEQVTQNVQLQSNYVTMRLGPVPNIAPMDLVVDHLNRRWRVVSVANTTRFGISVRQQPSLVRVTKGSVEDAIPLKVDTSNVQLRPSREYINPQVPGAASSIPDITTLLGTYGAR